MHIDPPRLRGLAPRPGSWPAWALPRPPRALVRVAARGFAAAAEALYPENVLGAPDWRDTEMATRGARWIDALPPNPQRLIVLLFAALELGAPALAPGLRPLSRLPPARREAMIRRWRASPIAPLKFLGDAVKSATSMIYLSHPAALRHVGLHKTCAHPGADLPVAHRPAALGPA